MTPTPDNLRALQIAVLTAMGWVQCKCGCNGWWESQDALDGGKNLCSLPPLTLDLINQAEQTLTPDEAIRFRLLLSENSGKRNAKYPSAEAAMCHATAEQRARAFLKVNGITP